MQIWLKKNAAIHFYIALDYIEFAKKNINITLVQIKKQSEISHF